MTDPQPYAPGSTGTLSDVLERGPELTPFTPAGPDGFKPAPTLGEMFSAARPQALHDTIGPAYDDAKIYEGYAPLVQKLGLPDSENPGYFGNLDAAGEARFGAAGSPSMLATRAQVGAQVPFARNRMADRALQESLIVDQIKARRAKDPNFAPGVPDTVEGLHAYFEQQQEAKRAAGAVVLSRGSTLGRFAAGAAAGISVTDPVQGIPQLLMGGTASSLVQAAGRDALINGVLSSSQTLANIAEGREHPGSFGAGVEDVLVSGAEGAAAGALLGATAHTVATHVAPMLTENLFKVLPETVQERWAAKMKVGDVPLADVLHDMDNRELAGFSRSTLGNHMTADEKAAADTLERSQELGEASPFVPGPIGDAAHNANLSDALKRFIDGNRGELLASTSSVAVRPPAPVAVPEDPGFGSQWSAIKGNEHGIGAHGEFLTSSKGAIGPAQVMPGTAPYAAKLAGLPWDEARYRGDAAYNEALGRAYYAEQLKTFGDPAKAAAAYNAGPGSAERGTGLRGAMRKAAEHGEPDNWEAYLPRETQRYVEDFRRRTGIQSGEAPVVASVAAAGEEDALARAADDADRDALELSRQQQTDDVADLVRDRADPAVVPELRRDLFPDDAAYADAQAAWHQSLNSDAEPVGRPLGVETASGAPEIAQTASGTPGASEAPPAPQSRERSPASYQIVDTHSGDKVVAKVTDFSEALAKQRDMNADAEIRNGVPRYLIGRADDAEASGPLTRAELEALRPADNDRDALWLAGSNIVTEQELGREPAPIWGVRDHETGELVSWAMKKGAAERARADQLNPEHLEVERLTPSAIAAELRDRLAAQRATASASDVRIDEPSLKAFDAPGGEGAKATVTSLEHDYRIAAADPDRAKRAYQLDDGGKPKTLAEILEEIDSDRKAAAALRACAGVQ
jgi:hypothetical protein